jgi:hypothetical protein
MDIDNQSFHDTFNWWLLLLHYFTAKPFFFIALFYQAE